MKYMGSKARIAKYILPIILANRGENQWLIDMFCGGCSISSMAGGRVIANDYNKYLIAMWNGLINNETRPTIIDRALYSSARNSFKTGDGAMSDFLIGWVGWMASYNGRFFDGGYSGHDVNGRDYISEQIKNTERGLYLLKNVVFTSKSYIDFKLKEPCIIYCDPPYAGTKGYSNSSEFNHDQFWEWCRFMAIQGHQVFISEYSSPSDFECIWRSEITNSMGLSKTYKPIECLFTFKASH